MAFWFEKGELRRFNRIDMPVKVYITPAQPINDQQIFALGVDYFPPTTQKKILTAEKTLDYWVRHIQEQQEVLAPVFADMVDSIKFFGRWTRDVSIGLSPKTEREDWVEFNRYMKGVETIHGLKITAPKTYQYFEQMNQKLRIYYQSMFNCIQQSTPKQFNVDSMLPDSMPVDDMMKRFESHNFAKIPLVQSLYHCYLLMEHHFRAYAELLKDCHLRKNPNGWEEVKVNLSACGISMMLEKRFKPHTRCDAYFYFAEKSRLITVRSTLVRACSDMADYKEVNAFNFEFPDEQVQRFIQLEIERYEIKSSLGVALA